MERYERTKKIHNTKAREQLEPVYLVATGEHCGQHESFTLHKEPPALCDYEKLYRTGGAQSNADKVEIEKEDRKMLLYLMNAFDTENWNCPSCTHVESTSEMDSAYFLREYLAKSTK